MCCLHRRRLAALFACLALSWTLVACAHTAAYADGLSCAELIEIAEAQAPVRFGYETYGSEQVQYCFSDTQLPDDCCLRYSVLSEDINEIGIFHTVGKADQKAMQELCRTYLQDLLGEKSAFIAGYAPEELPKLTHAEVRCFGNYTVYVIASDAERAQVFRALEEALQKE